MMRGIATIGALISVVLFPWPLSVALAVCAAVYEPLVPLAVGILFDVFYFTPQGTTLPFFTIAGAVGTGVALFVHSRLRTGTL